VGQRVLKIFRCTMRSWLPARTPSLITVAAEMHFPRWFEICLLWPFSSSGISPVALSSADDGTASRLVLLRNPRSLRVLFAGTGFLCLGFCLGLSRCRSDGATLIFIVVLYVEDAQAPWHGRTRKASRSALTAELFIPCTSGMILTHPADAEADRAFWVRHFCERPLNELARNRPSEVMSRYSTSAKISVRPR
jgi:hypothetical protein